MKDYKKGLQSNIWKFFLIVLTNRRNYMPILAIYFLTLPNTLANQIGLFTGIGWIAGFLLEIPSGYLSDKWGHKNALLIAKFSMLFSTLCFVFGKSLPFFIAGSSLMAAGFAFTSGTWGAFLHNTLVGLKREKEYAKLSAKIGAKASLASAVLILLLPLFTKISLLTPIIVYLFFDVAGILVTLSVHNPKMKFDARDEEGEHLFSQLKRFKGNGFYITSIFLGLIGGFVMGLSTFKAVYAESLGFPIIFIGSLMALSRLIWFVVGYKVEYISKIKIKNLLFYEIFLFSGLMILSSYFKNPYLVGALLAIMVGYYHGRVSLMDQYYLDNFLINKRYKATMFSIKAQSGKLFEAFIVFLIGFVMAISYARGYLVAGLVMFGLLVLIYPFLRKILK